MGGIGDFPASVLFEQGWNAARFSTDRYWSPTNKDWPRFDSGAVTRITHGKLGGELKPVNVSGAYGATSVWPLVESSWQTAKEGHPDAVWSPRDGAWYDAHGSGGGTAKVLPLSSAAVALQQRLAEIETMFNARPQQIDAVTRQQLRNQAFREYGKQLSAPPP